MRSKLARYFICSAGILLLATAVAKFVGANGSAPLLYVDDPLLMVPFRTVFWVVGGVELALALFCFLSKRVTMQLFLLAGLSTNFVVYRLGLIWVGYHEPCPCLGNLTDALHISPGAADYLMKCILAYVLIGSLATLALVSRQNGIILNREVIAPATGEIST